MQTSGQKNKFLLFKPLLFFILIVLSSACQQRFQIAEGVYDQAFQKYQSQVFEKEFEKDLSREEKMAILTKVSQEYKIPPRKMIQYIETKYPKYHEDSLAPADKGEKK